MSVTDERFIRTWQPRYQGSSWRRDETVAVVTDLDGLLLEATTWLYEWSDEGYIERAGEYDDYYQIELGEGLRRTGLSVWRADAVLRSSLAYEWEDERVGRVYEPEGEGWVEYTYEDGRLSQTIDYRDTLWELQWDCP